MAESDPGNSTDVPPPGDTSELWNPYEPYYPEGETYISANVACIIIVFVLLVTNLDKLVHMPNRRIKIALGLYYGIDLFLNFLSAMVYNPRLYYDYLYRQVFDTRVLYALFALQQTLLSFMLYETISPWLKMRYGKWTYLAYGIMAIELALGEATGVYLGGVGVDPWDVNFEIDPSYVPVQFSWSALHFVFELAVFGYLARQMFMMRAMVNEVENGKSLPAFIMMSMGFRVLTCLGFEIINIIYNESGVDYSVVTPPALMVAANITWSIRPMIVITDMARAKALSSLSEKNSRNASPDSSATLCRVCGQKTVGSVERSAGSAGKDQNGGVEGRRVVTATAAYRDDVV
ncbi:hypothetical protein HK104_011461 [Borealophlyctis nickersoniae]|nr:hypothetical protein HK104_011461 [Borealophlyctis nickersoniae]